MTLTAAAAAAAAWTAEKHCLLEKIGLLQQENEALMQQLFLYKQLEDQRQNTQHQQPQEQPEATHAQNAASGHVDDDRYGDQQASAASTGLPGQITTVQGGAGGRIMSALVNGVGEDHEEQGRADGTRMIMIETSSKNSTPHSLPASPATNTTTITYSGSITSSTNDNGKLQQQQRRRIVYSKHELLQ
jgi:hypothetical protein